MPFLKGRGASLVLFSDVFILNTDVPGQICTGGNEHRCHRTFGDASSPYAAQRAAGQSFANEFSNVHFFDTASYFCSSGVCGANVPGNVYTAYIDDDHINFCGARYLWPHMCGAFSQWGLM